MGEAPNQSPTPHQEGEFRMQQFLEHEDEEREIQAMLEEEEEVDEETSHSELGSRTEAPGPAAPTLTHAGEEEEEDDGEEPEEKLHGEPLLVDPEDVPARR